MLELRFAVIATESDQGSFIIDRPGRVHRFSGDRAERIDGGGIGGRSGSRRTEIQEEVLVLDSCFELIDFTLPLLQLVGVGERFSKGFCSRWSNFGSPKVELFQFRQGLQALQTSVRDAGCVEVQIFQLRESCEPTQTSVGHGRPFEVKANEVWHGGDLSEAGITDFSAREIQPTEIG